MQFEYQVVRLWERPAEELLAGGLGTAVLAMLGQLPAGADEVEGLTGVAQRLIERMDREASREQAKNLLTSAYVLTGLRVSKDVSRKVFAGVRAMKDSATFMEILDEGRETQTRRLIQRLAEKRLGAPDEQTRTRLEGITEIGRLERIHDRAMDASSWQDLLDTP
jgi:predicted transposase YdaD